MLAGFGVLLWRCSGPDYRERVDHPMTLAEAKRHRIFADFPFPASAHNIYFAGYADWLVHETLIRFDASKSDCEGVIPKILAWYEKEQNRDWTYQVVPITDEVDLPGPLEANWLPRVDWWSGVKVKHGFYGGKDSSNTPQVWVDSDLDRVYFYETD
jgi:hypothetical protein